MDHSNDSFVVVGDGLASILFDDVVVVVVF